MSVDCHVGSSDWEWWDDCVPQKLKDLHSQGYRVVFFTNQAGIEKLKTKPEDIMKKVEDMIAELGIPVLVRDRENRLHAFKQAHSRSRDNFDKSIACLGCFD